jgi:hypothetical protein
MNVKLANPIYYPVAVLIGGIVLVVGVRFLNISNFIILPTAVVSATGIAALLKSRETKSSKVLGKETRPIALSAQSLAQKAELLRQEANNLLTNDSEQLELLIVVQSACDRAIELPEKITRLSQRLNNNESLLSVGELQQQLVQVQNKIKASSGIAREHLQQLKKSLEKNIQLAQAGQNTRQAQIINLQTLIQESAGILQQLQNKLRIADLTRSEEVQELKNLSNELNSYQENFNILLD